MTSCISQFYVLSPRGDKIIFKDYRGDVIRSSDEVFFRKYKFWDPASTRSGGGSADAPPFFNVDGVNYIHVKRSNLLFVAVTRHNSSPSLLSELLTRITKIMKDFLGVLTEEALRKNFILVYEILDEIIDFGYAQETSTEKLRPFIANEPLTLAPESPAQNRWFPGQAGRKSSDAPNKSIVSTEGRSNEIFVDILEKLTVVFNANGSVSSAVIDGALVMKSFLAGSPEVQIALNEDLVIGRDHTNRTYSTVALDDCNFHEVVNYESFERDRTLMFHPPDGEFAVMNYRVTGAEFTMPFRITPSLDQHSPYKLEVTLKVRSDLPATAHGANCILRFNVPKTTTSVAVELGVGAIGQSYEYNQTEKTVVWGIKKFSGGVEHMMKARISLGSPVTGNLRKEIGPVSMAFEVPNHNVSGLALRSLRIEERSKKYNPTRWVRNITQANSYICRL